MSLAATTTKAVSDNIIAQLEASLGQTIPLFPKSFTRILAKVLAGVFVLLYKYAGFMFLQIFVRTATADITTINGKQISPLIAWGRLIGVGDPIAATQAEMTITITVESQVGSLASGAQLINSANGVTYITIGDILLNAPTVVATIRAVADQSGGNGAGAIGNLNVNDVVSFANPLSNVSRNAIVASQVVTGADAEAIEAYRQRVLDRFQKRPQGGAYADYELWGEEVAGIANIYPYTSTTPGIVNVYVEATPASSGSPDGIPTAAQLQAVRDAINYDQSGLASRRPANALINVAAITRVGFDVTVLGITVDNLAAVQAQITTAITQFFLDAEPYIDGLTIPPRKDRIARSALVAIIADIVTAANGTFTTVYFSQTGSAGSLELYVLQEGEKAKRVTITYV